MNAVTTANANLPTKISSKFDQFPQDDSLGAGISAGFGTIGYKGKTWSTRYKGEKRDLMRPDGDGPRNSIDVVILKAAKVLSKTWYEKYVEGSTESPDCASVNGVTPDVGVPKKQSDVCALCPKNVWGTAVLADGSMGKGKACKDNKRLAVVFANAGENDPKTVKNGMFGGPMMLRVPPASLQDLKRYSDRLNSEGYPPPSVITKIAFDPAAATPQFVFTPQRPLTDDETDVVLGLLQDPQVDRILAEEPNVTVPAPSAIAAHKTEPLFATPLPPVVPMVNVVTPPSASVVTPMASTVTPEVTEPKLSTKFESELDDLLAS